MRIFCAVRHSVDPTRYYGALWSQNFYPALQQLGHEVIESQTDLLPASRFMHIASDFTSEEQEVRAQVTQSIVDEVKAAHNNGGVDLFLSYFYNSHFDPAGFDEIRRLGIPSVNFYCNSIYQFDLVKDVAAKVDFAWHAERDARDLYVRVGANPVWVQMGADPSVYHPVRCERRQNACFVGQRYADRDRWIAALIKADVPLALYGPGWDGGSAPATNGSKEEVFYLGRRSPLAGTGAALKQAVIRNWQSNGAVKGTWRTWRQFRYRMESQRLSPLFVPYAKGALPFAEQRAVFSASEVVLNFSNVWADGRPGSALIPHVRLRDFEAPMCGSCYLTGHTEEIQEFYHLGREIETYRTTSELIDKVRFFLDQPEAAENMRKLALERARRCHTWKQRFIELFDKLGSIARNSSVQVRS